MTVQDVKLSIDVGGTFTDAVAQRGTTRWTTKVLTTPRAPEEGIMSAATEVLGMAGLSLGDVDIFIHGTTLATNAIIERRGARTALIATAGFRDVIEIGSESRYDQYDLALVKPVPLVDRQLRFTVPERIDARGKELLPLDEAAVRDLAPGLRALGIESVAIAFLHSYANGAHEQRAAEVLAEEMPGLSISISSEICPEIREYERTSTTVANAYVRPLMESYLIRLEERLAEAGFTGFLSLMTSGGGLTPVAQARRVPVRLVESGPAGGAVFAAQVAARLGEPDVLAFDMGGTTAKVSLLRKGEFEHSRFFEVDRAARFMKGSGLPILIPVVEMVEIGAGGGSIARVDALKRVTIGPESASSDPGPACYGRGGTRPAVSDANVVLGLLDPDSFARGTIRLDPALAGRALDDAVGVPLALSTEDSAFAVYEMVSENMANAARVHAVERGAVISDHTMIAFGGAAPLHAARVAEILGIGRVAIPRNAGVGSAVGFLAAPLSYEIVRSDYMRLGTFDAAAATQRLEGMAAEIRIWLEPAARGEPLVERRIAFMRYVGQGYEIPIELPGGPLPADFAATLTEAYEAAYREAFERNIPGAEVEILAWSVRLSGRPAPVAAAAAAPPAGMASSQAQARLYDGRRGGKQEIPVYRREAIAPGMTLSGPAVIIEDETTTYVTARFDARIDAIGTIILERKMEQAIAAE